MKKIAYIAIICLFVLGCKKEPKDYVTFSGKITNKTSDSIMVFNPQTGFKKVIKVDEKGVFKDTLKVENGFFTVLDGKKQAPVYFQNGDDIKLTFDTKTFNETINFTGSGAEESSFLARVVLLQKNLFASQDLFKLPKDEFDAKVNSFIADFNELLNNKEYDKPFVEIQQQNIKGLKGYMDKMYAEKASANKLTKGMPSPKFIDYENYKEGTTSLDDLRGKYVYIDIWATWCPPCKAEIPFLQKIEKQYHNKNIHFVSISIDEKRDYETWKKMVADKNLGGIQLYANGDAKFTNAYRVTGIPRFILLDPEGNIINANAPRPSDPKLVELFNSLKI